MAVQVSVEERKTYRIRTNIEIPEGEDAITIKLPATVPSGKVGKAMITIVATLENAS